MYFNSGQLITRASVLNILCTVAAGWRNGMNAAAMRAGADVGGEGESTAATLTVGNQSAAADRGHRVILRREPGQQNRPVLFLLPSVRYRPDDRHRKNSYSLYLLPDRLLVAE